MDYPLKLKEQLTLTHSNIKLRNTISIKIVRF